MNPRRHYTNDGVYTPMPVRLVNSLARKAKPVFDRLVLLNSENLKAAAARQTGLRDWGDARFEEALDALLQSVNREGKLTFFGRFAFRQFLMGNLASRLRTIEVLKRFPEIQEQKIQKPIFITGWYRSGTTHLHNLLALHPDLRAPHFWELRHPCPTLNPRAADTQKYIRKVKLDSKIHGYLAPGFSDIHALEAEGPEECLHLFDKACAGTTSFFMTETNSFTWWLLDHSPQSGYDFFKSQLQLLNWQRPGRQWVLKWPYHLWHLETLLKTFPDATVIHLHRDPRQAIPSVCSLAAAARAPFVENIDYKALGEFWLKYCAAGLERGLKARQQAKANQIIDIRYSDLKMDPLSVINQIQRIVKLDGMEAWTAALEADLRTAPIDRPQSHHYTPAQFALAADQIRERFSGYIQDYELSADVVHRK